METRLLVRTAGSAIEVTPKRNRGYYTAAQRYEFYFRVVKTIFYERAQRVCKMLRNIEKIKSVSLSDRVCANNREKWEMTSSMSSLVRIWKRRLSGPGCSFVCILRVVYFPVICLCNKT